MTSFLAGRLLPLAVPTTAAECDALEAGLASAGVGTVEIGLRSPFSVEAIARITRGGRLSVGAGTVTTADQVDQVHDMGARFIVSPGLSTSVVTRARQLGLPVIPGVATATEAMQARELGLTTLKVFPAETLGGVSFIDALRAVLPGVTYVPSGGVSLSNLAEYLSNPGVCAVSGSWLTSATLLQQGAAAIAQVAGETVAAIQRIAVTDGGRVQ